MAPDDDPSSLALPEQGTGERARRRREREQRAARLARVRRGGTVLAMVLLAAAIPVLSYIGFRAVLTSTAGRRLDAVTDPAKPGYEANVAPTPVELVAQVDGDQKLTAFTVLALGPADAGGAVLFVPVTTQVPAYGAHAATTLADAYAASGSEGLGRAAAHLLGFGFDELTVLDDARWGELVAPLAPLPFLNPDRLRTPAFAAGPIQLDAASVGPYLAARTGTETEVARLSRHEAFWKAWIGAIGASPDPGVVPGETAAGIGRFTRGLGRGPVEIVTMPVEAAADGGVALRPAAATLLLARLVPFPTGGPDNQRVRVRLLDGVGRPGLAVEAAQLLVPAGAEIAIIGNADRFGYDASAVRYSDDALTATADVMLGALGFGSTERGTALDDVVDLTIVLGKDFADRYGSTTTTTATTGESSSG